MSFQSKRLQELRKSKGLNQRQMGEIIGINERNYRRYEAGLVNPRASVVVLLADFFDVSTDYLLGRAEDPHSHKNKPII